MKIRYILYEIALKNKWIALVLQVVKEHLLGHISSSFTSSNLAGQLCRNYLILSGCPDLGRTSTDWHQMMFL